MYSIPVNKSVPIDPKECDKTIGTSEIPSFQTLSRGARLFRLHGMKIQIAFLPKQIEHYWAAYRGIFYSAYYISSGLILFSVYNFPVKAGIPRL